MKFYKTSVFGVSNVGVLPINRPSHGRRLRKTVDPTSEWVITGEIPRSHFLVATKGEPGSFSTHGLTNIPNIIRAPRLKHSQKPEEFWTIADRLADKLENCERLGKLSEPSRIELFSRTPRPNWDFCGAEAE